MKIAICISGHLRTFELTHQSLRRNVLDKYDCDVFISTWNNIGNTTYHELYPKGFDESDERIKIDRVKEVYKPTSILVEDSLDDAVQKIKKPFEGLKTRNNAELHHVVPMFYKMWNCNRLKIDHEEKNGFKYDVTIKCRPDVYVNSINMEMCNKRAQFMPAHCGLNDIIFGGPNDAMNDIFDLYTVLSPDIPFRMVENAENILYEHVINNNIPYEISSAINYWFVRNGVFDYKGQKICEMNQLSL